MTIIIDYLDGESGFTLLELIVVVGVIAVISSIIVPHISNFQDDAKRSIMFSDINSIETIVARFIIARNAGEDKAKGIDDHPGGGTSEEQNKDWNEYSAELLSPYTSGKWPEETPFGGYYCYRFYPKKEDNYEDHLTNWQKVSDDEVIEDAVDDFPFEVIMIRFSPDEESAFNKVITMLEGSKYYSRLYRYNDEFTLGILIP